MKNLTIYCFCVLTALSLNAQDSTMVRKWIKDLSAPDMYGRSFAYQGDSIAATYIKQQLITAGIAPLQDNYYQSYQLNDLHNIHNTQNVCAKVEGTEYPDSMLLFMAHYDHIGVIDGVVFPGAHDNASGTATVMALAHYFKKNPSPYTTVFCFFSGEELGLKGSIHFVEHLIIDLKKVKIAINIDLACGGNDGIMMVNSQADDTRWFYDRFVEINNEKGYLPEVKSRPNAANSDHYPFVKNGVPALFIYTLGGKSGEYHQPTDTNENCSLEKWEDIFHLMIDAMNFN